MKRKRFDEGGDVEDYEDYEKTAADYDDERPSGAYQSRRSTPKSTPARAVKTVSRAAPEPAAKPAAKPAVEAPKAAAEAPARKTGFVDRLPASSGLRQIRARGMGEALPSGPSADDVEAARSRVVERERAMRDRPTGLGRMFSAIRERGDRDLRARGLAKGGAVSASRRADGIAMRGKTKGRMI